MGYDLERGGLAIIWGDGGRGNPSNPVKVCEDNKEAIGSE